MFHSILLSVPEFLLSLLGGWMWFFLENFIHLALGVTLTDSSATFPGMGQVPHRYFPGKCVCRGKDIICLHPGAFWNPVRMAQTGRLSGDGSE